MPTAALRSILPSAIAIAISLIGVGTLVAFRIPGGHDRPSLESVGGVRLVYQVYQPDGMQVNDLANQMIDCLKRRIDPQGVSDFVWTTIGPDRLEIDIPAKPQKREEMVAYVKKLLHGQGRLEFHIVADRITANAADLQVMDDRLASGGKGPAVQPGDTMRWLEVDDPAEFDRPGFPRQTRDWDGKHYLLVLTTPDASMNSGAGGWALNSAGPTSDDRGGRALSFEFNSPGATQFAQLTRHWTDLAKKGPMAGQHPQLAIALDDHLLTAPNLLEPITGGSGVISAGGGAGFSNEEVTYLISVLNSGPLPGRLSDKPISEKIVEPTTRPGQ